MGDFRRLRKLLDITTWFVECSITFSSPERVPGTREVENHCFRTSLFFFLLPLPSIIDTRYHPLHFRVLTSSLSNQPISIEPLFSIGFTPLGITFRDHKILRGPKNVLCLMNKQKKVYRTPPVQSLSSLSSSSPYLCHSRANAYPVDLQLTRISRPVESRTRNGCI